MGIATTEQSHAIALYPDFMSATDALRRMHMVGMPIHELSIVGKEFQTAEKPLGFVITGIVADGEVQVHTNTGGIFGFMVGAAFLILPEVGPIISLGPLSDALLGNAEGTALVGLSGAMFRLGVSWNAAIQYEAQVKAGKFLVVLRGDKQQAMEAVAVFLDSGAEVSEVVPAVTTA